VDDGVRVSKDGGVATITWNPAPGSAWFELARGLVRALPAGTTGGSGGICLADVILGTSATDADIPDPGEAFWYLVRGANACGRGPYGFELVGGVPTPRIVVSCP
jgi:hypothetical protein